MFELSWYGKEYIWVIALIASIAILVIWIASFIIAEIWKHAWAWIDDSKPEKYNFMVSKINTIIKSKWKYSDKRGNTCIYAPPQEYNTVTKTILITSLTPFIVLICIKLYAVVMVIGCLILMAHLSRLTRRLGKEYKLHVDNKNIHIQPEKE